jgi:hypothetical protein
VTACAAHAEDATSIVDTYTGGIAADFTYTADQTEDVNKEAEAQQWDFSTFTATDLENSAPMAMPWKSISTILSLCLVPLIGLVFVH